jgi:glutathione S-transferase
MYTLYSMQRSGNSYKVRLAFAQLRVPHKLVELDILKGETRTPDFLAKNPNGRVPVLEVAPGRHLVPDDAIRRAEALQWMFFEQHSLEPNLGSARFWLTMVKGGRELQSHGLDDWMEKGYEALGVMEKHLQSYRYFVDDRYTIADIALYAYTHVAHESDYDLTTFPAIRTWLKRVAAEPGHIAMDLRTQTMAIAE